MSGRPPQPLLSVKNVMAVIEEVVRSVVDVHQNNVETAAGVVLVKTLRRRGPGKKVTLGETAPLIPGKLGAKGQQPGGVPLDNGGKQLDNQQRTYRAGLQYRSSRVSQTQPSYNNIKAARFFGIYLGKTAQTLGDSNLSEGALRFGEVTSHQVFVSQFDLVDHRIKGGGPSAA